MTQDNCSAGIVNNDGTEMFELVIKRIGLTSCLQPTKIAVDGVEKGGVLSNSPKSFFLPRRQFRLELFQNVLMGKKISKKITLNPGTSRRVELVFRQKLDLLCIVLPITIFFRQIHKIVVVSITHN